MANTDPFLKLIQLSEAIWHERKGLDVAYSNGEKKRSLKRLKKLWTEILELQPKMETEWNVLTELKQIKK